MSEKDQALLYAYHDGELSGFARRRFERRLRRSPAFQRELERLADVGEQLQQFDSERAEPELWDGVALQLSAIDARRAEAIAAAVRSRRVGGIPRWVPAGAFVALVVAVGVGLLWPREPERGQGVRWVDAGSRSVLVLDDDPETTIIWMLDGLGESASRGGDRNEV
jgi:anti-sigma factor RsiW